MTDNVAFWKPRIPESFLASLAQSGQTWTAPTKYPAGILSFPFSNLEIDEALSSTGTVPPVHIYELLRSTPAFEVLGISETIAIGETVAIGPLIMPDVAKRAVASWNERIHAKIVRQPTSSLPDLRDALNEILFAYHIARRFIIREPKQVHEFVVHQHPQLVRVLAEAIPYLDKHFGRDTEVELIVADDPEENSRELFAEINTQMRPEEALERLHSFDSEWFLGQLRHVGGLMNFSLAFP